MMLSLPLVSSCTTKTNDINNITRTVTTQTGPTLFQASGSVTPSDGSDSMGHR